MTKNILILLSLLGCAEIISATQVTREKVLNFQRKPQHQKTNEPLFMSQIAKRSERNEKMEVEDSIKSTNALQNVTSHTPSGVTTSGEYVAPVRISYLPLEATIMPALEPDPELEKAKKDKEAAVHGAVTSQENRTISLESILNELCNRTPEEQSALRKACQNIFGPRPARKKPVATEIAQAFLDAQKTKAAAAEALLVSVPSLNDLLNGEEMPLIGPKVIARFQRLREDGELTKEWGLSEDTISRLGRLIRLAREAAANN